MTLGGGLGSQGRYNQYFTTQFTNSGIDYARASFVDDFVGTGVNTTIWTVGGGGGTATTGDSTIGIGRLTLSTGAVLNQDVLLDFNGVQHLPWFASDKKVEVEFNSVYFNSVADVVAYLELYNAANNYIRLELDPGTYADANWRLVRDDTTGAAVIDTGIAATTTASARAVWKFVQNAANDFTLYYKAVGSTSLQKDFTSITNVTTKIPTGAFEPRFYVKTTAGAGVDKIMYVDAFKYSSLRANV